MTPAPRRAEILYRAAELLCRRKQELGELVTREMGKVLPEGLGDVQEAIDMAYYMAGEGRRLTGETVPLRPLLGLLQPGHQQDRHCRAGSGFWADLY